MIKFIVELIGSIFFLILGGISMSKRILKPKTLIYTNCIALTANLLYMFLGILTGLYFLVILELTFSVMSFYCIFKFRRLWKNEKIN